MPRRVKEEVLGLLKEPDNRRCINCNSLGPQYVCTTFWTFVCTNCSGVHREFTHRVKSVSMAKFNEDEIAALQAGGNERARQIYFKAWDPQRNSYPDSCNRGKLREFFKQVYVERRYAGEKNSNKLSTVKLDSRSSWSGRGDFLERFPSERTSSSGRDYIHKSSSFDKSSPYKIKNARTFKDIWEERSPRCIQENAISSISRNHSAHFEIVDDRFRDNGNVKHYERNINRESRSGNWSSGSRITTSTSLPVIRPLKDIMGEKVPALTIDGPPKANDGRDSTKGQKAADAEKQKQHETVSSRSLIDFDVEPERTSNMAEPQAHISASINNKENNSTASSTTQMASNAPNVNSLESWLFDWSDSVASLSAGTIKAPEVSNSIETLSITTTENDESLDRNREDPMVQVTQEHQLPSKYQNQTFLSPPRSNSSNAQQSATSIDVLYNQQWNKSPAPNDQRPVQSVLREQSSQAYDPGDGSRTNARKEIPQDLFSSNATLFAPPVANWQMHPPYGREYGLQFHPPPMSVAGFPNPVKPQNPFDIGDDTFQVQAATFASMSPLQGASPTMPASTGLQSQPSPYAKPMSSHVSPYGMNMPLVPGTYLRQLPNNMALTRPQEVAELGRSEDAFSSLNPIQNTNSWSTAHNSSVSRVGNPFE